MTEVEIWKMIPGYEGRYQASTLGRIRSIMGKKPRILVLNVYKGSPYYKVQLTDAAGNKKWYRVHRLIYITFFGPIPEGLVIDHADGNKTNNACANLRALSNKANSNNPNTVQNYRIRHHRPGEHERRSHGQKDRFARSEEREKHRERLKKAWQKRKNDSKNSSYIVQ